MVNNEAQWQLVSGFSRVRLNLEQAIIEFPRPLREERLFGDWTVVHLLAHINGWDSYTQEALNLKKSGNNPVWGGTEEEVNARSLEVRQGMSWGGLVRELMMIREEVINAYDTVPDELWQQAIWSDHPEITPERSILDDIDHYQAHLQDLQDKLRLNK